MMFVNILIWFVCELIFGGFCMPLADKKGHSAMTAFWLGLFFQHRCADLLCGAAG